MEKERKNRTIVLAWILLLILIIMLGALNYLKFFGRANPNISQTPTNSDESKAITIALQEIVDNFNNDDRIAQYKEEGIIMQAVLNNTFLFISYTTDTTIIYEFNYHDFLLDIDVSNNPENLERFSNIYELLITAVQKRLNNTEKLDSHIQSFLDGSKKYEGLFKKEDGNTITYQMNITMKLKENEFLEENIVSDNIEKNEVEN